MRYFGTSVLRSAPGATPTGSGEPTSVTSMSGHGLGLRWQKSMKSYAQSLGRIARLAWTKPGASPAVTPASLPLRMSARISFGWRASIGIRASLLAVYLVLPEMGERGPEVGVGEPVRLALGGGFAPLPKPPPRTRCASKAGARTVITSRGASSTACPAVLPEMSELGPEVGVAEGVRLLAPEHPQHLGRHLHGHRASGLRGDPRHVRADDDIGQVQQRVVGGDRFLLEHVD